MKKIYSVSIIIICSLFLFPISKVLAKGSYTPIYVNFVINNGLSITGDKEDGVRLNVRSDSFILIGASSLSETAFCDQLNCAESYLSYTNAPNYQNAQCTVDGVLKVSGETLKLSVTPSSPTQIVCTAEKIEETPPDEPEEPDTPEGQNSSVDFNLNISEMLEITGLPSTINLDIDSSNFGALATTTLNLFTSSNYAYGYNFTLLTDSTNLTDSTTSAAIPTLASGTYTDANFTTNRWGLSLDSTNFRPISTTNSLNSTTAPATRIPTTITLGVKLDATQPAGAYSTVLNFALTPNIVTE